MGWKRLGFKPNLYALSKKTKSRIPPSIIHIFYQLKVRFKLDSMHLTIGKFLWPQITPRSELLGLKSYCALKICSLLVKKMSISGSKNRFLQKFSKIPSMIMTQKDQSLQYISASWSNFWLLELSITKSVFLDFLLR